MAGSFKTEAIVLRSIRYGEADRIVHLYSREYGRIGAIAKGLQVYVQGAKTNGEIRTANERKANGLLRRTLLD